MRPTLAVVIPTYRRPDMLRNAVASVLAQEIAGVGVEVVIAVSDPADRATRTVADELARDPHVHVALSRGQGPAAARNAGMAAVAWDHVAFIDDDCVACGGWAAAGVAALQQSDLVQGRTLPMRDVPRWHHSIRIEGITQRWETCNVFARRSAVEAAGGFDETLLRRTRVPWGEDTEWGWRVLRSGARPGYCADALVLHEVVPRTLRPYLAYHARMRHFPLLLRTVPELRSQYFLGYFWNRRHAALAAAATSTALGLAAARGGRRPLGAAMVAGGAALTLAPLVEAPEVGARKAVVTVLKDLFEVACLVTGSIRWRRLLL